MLIPPLQNVQAPQRYSLVPRPSPLGAPLIDLLGRRKGLVPFLLGLAGLKSTARLIVTDEEVNCETVTFTGTSVELIPLNRVADVHVAEYRPLPKLVSGLFFMFVGASNFFVANEMALQAVGLLMAVLAVALIIAYFKKRRLMLAVISESGLPIAIVLETGKIRNQMFQLSDLVNIQRTIRMLAAGDRSGVTAGAPFETHAGDDDEEIVDEDEVEIEEPDVHWQAPVVEAVPRASAMAAEQTARRLLDDARRRAKDGDRDGAIRLLRELVDAYPETTPAEQARKNLSKIGIKP